MFVPLGYALCRWPVGLAFCGGCFVLLGDVGRDSPAGADLQSRTLAQVRYPRCCGVLSMPAAAVRPVPWPTLRAGAPCPARDRAPQAVADLWPGWGRHHGGVTRRPCLPDGRRVLGGP